MNVGVMQNATNYILHDVWSVGHKQPEEDTARNGTMDCLNPVFTPKSEGHGYKISYSRKFDTGDVNDIAIKAVNL